MGLIDKLIEKGHHGIIYTIGKNQYIYDRTDRCVYNLRTGHKLKWQYSEGTKSMLKIHKEIKPEDVNRFVELFNGYGKHYRTYETDFIDLKFIPHRSDLNE